MFRQFAPIAAVCLAALAMGLPAMSQDQPAQVLVLRNGQFLEGRITRDEDHYVVGLPDGQIRIKAADVDVICNSLEDGYQRKRAAIQVGTVQDHLDLTQWCLRHNLLGPAAAELADAIAAEPNHPMIPVLKHRLKLALEPAAAPGTENKVRPGVSNDELDRMIRSLPHGAVEQFTQSVQPLLMNHCTASGCHGPQADNELRLFRVPIGKQTSRRITQRNLYSVLQFVDRDNPAASRLLSAASSPHGTARHAVFTEYQAIQYRRLVDWASQVAQQPVQEMPATVTPSPFMQPEHPAPAEKAPRVLTSEAKSARRLPAQPPANRESSDAHPASFGDPLDPESFNRRYAPAKPTAKSDAQ